LRGGREHCGRGVAIAVTAWMPSLEIGFSAATETKPTKGLFVGPSAGDVAGVAAPARAPSQPSNIVRACRRIHSDNHATGRPRERGIAPKFTLGSTRFPPGRCHDRVGNVRVLAKVPERAIPTGPATAVKSHCLLPSATEQRRSLAALLLVGPRLPDLTTGCRRLSSNNDLCRVGALTPGRSSRQGEVRMCRRSGA
jgi:hypothetical protein